MARHTAIARPTPRPTTDLRTARPVRRTSWIRPALLALLAVIPILGTPRSTFAEVEPPPLRRDIGAYALFGRSLVKWQGASRMPVRAGVGSSSLVEFPARTEAGGDESYVAAPSVVADDASHLHFVYAASFEASDDVVLDHPVASLEGPLVADIDYPRLPAGACNDQDVTVSESESPLLLAPGRYGDVVVESEQALHLVAGGHYEMCSLRLRAGASVETRPGTSIRILDYLVTAARVRIAGRDGIGSSDGCGARWIVGSEPPSYSPTGAAIDFGQGAPAARARIEGDFFTTGRLVMAQHNDYAGRFWGDRVEGRGADAITRTLSDCHASRCGDGVVDDGEACDDGNNRDGDCCSAFCEVAAVGAACEDGLFCTVDDRCDADGRCVGAGDPCEAPDGDANCSESCNETSDACDGPDPDASACDDGLYCNGTDQCAGGQCVVHSGAPCPGPDQDGDCRESCDEATRTCTAQDPVGAACSDGRFCTVDEACTEAGLCAGGHSPCPGGDADGDCAEGCDELLDSCTAFDADGTFCDDGLFCTATDACDGRGNCLGHGDPCAAIRRDDDAHCSQACDEQARACTAPEADGAPCSDGLACTLADRCLAGSCQTGGLTSCDDFNPCTDEFCGADGTCQRSYNALPCDDGNPCTTGDRCLRGECTGTGVVDCRDDDLCSRDTCDPADGSCHHDYAPADHCDTMGRSTTRVDLRFSPRDGAPVERLMTSWRSESSDDPLWREQLGDPSLGEAFSVCFYDHSLEVPDLAYRLDLNASTLEDTTWKRSARGDSLVFKLRAPSGTSQGVSSVRLGGGKRGSPTFRLRAGAGGGCSGDCRSKFQPPVATSDGRLFAMDPSMTVQWVSSRGACWSSSYGQAQANTPQRFRARVRPR